jgi:hypothetical protein
MNKFYAYAPTYFGVVLLFFFWRGYNKLPLKHIETSDIAYKEFTLKSSWEEVSLPSGYAGDMSIIVNEAEAAFRLSGIDKSKFNNAVAKGDPLQVGYARQQENELGANTTIQAFALKASGESYLDAGDTVSSHNKMISEKERMLYYLGGGTVLVFLLTLWLLRRRK